MPRRYRHTATVVCPLSFPIDMLRYDGCYPRHETDSAKIDAVNKYYRDPTPEDRRIEVERIDNQRSDPWTTPRWESFSAKIENIATEALES